LQNPCETIGDNLNNVRHEASRTCRNKKREYLKEEIKNLETNNKNKKSETHNRGINEFKNG
jgi:hypothetical protein